MSLNVSIKGMDEAVLCFMTAKRANCFRVVFEEGMKPVHVSPSALATWIKNKQADIDSQMSAATQSEGKPK